jgi:hypothetical protein
MKAQTIAVSFLTMCTNVRGRNSKPPAQPLAAFCFAQARTRPGLAPKRLCGEGYHRACCVNQMGLAQACWRLPCRTRR